MNLNALVNGKRNNKMQRASLLLHRMIGLAAALFLGLLAITGLLLNHPALLGGASARVRALAVDPVDPQRMWRGTEAGLFRSEDNGRTWGDWPNPGIGWSFAGIML